MELKTYSDFKRQLAEISGGTALTTDICSLQTKTASNTSGNVGGSDRRNQTKRSFLFEAGNGVRDNNSHIISNSLSSSNHSSRKRMKTSDRLSPLSLPRSNVDNNVNADNCNNSVISSSNSSINTNTSVNGDTSNQGINNNVPFAASTWWKKGNEHIRELMSTSITSTGALPTNINNSCDNSCASNAGNGINNNENNINIKTISNENTNRTSAAEPVSSSSFPPTLAMHNTGSRMTGNSIAAAMAAVPSSAATGDQKSSSWLQLLGEVASSGGNNHRGMHHPQHQLLQQQELQALRMQENNIMTNPANHNALLVGPSPIRDPSSLNNNPMSRMAIQSRMSAGNILDPSIFPSEGLNMSQLQLQQQQHFQQQQQHQYNLQQQSLFPFAFPHANSPMYSTQNSFLQQRQHQAQRQQVQRPEAARAELKIDGIRTSGDIGVAPLPAVDRELEESYRQDASFNAEGNNVGIASEAQKTNHGNKRKDNMEMMDVNDLGFSDILPMIPTSGSQSLKAEGFDTDCVNVDDVDVGVDIDVGAMVVGSNNMDTKLTQQQSGRSLPFFKNQSKLSPYPRQNPRVKEVKFRAYQAENWTEKFEELLRFREENGHCLVPNCHPENPALAQWTKRQRYQYKLKQDGKRSTITDERVRALDEAGFVWDSHKAVWSERLEELKDFKKQYKHCNVPSRYKPNHQLAIWVKRQRRQWKNKLDRLPNCMTDDRQIALEAIGFVWDMKKGKKSPMSSPSKP